MWTTPKTWTVGSPATSSDLNAYIRDNTAFLYGDLSWTTPSFTNGWVAATSFFPSFRKVGTRVVMRGAVKNGTVAATMFTLPTGYQPLAGATPGIIVNANGAAGLITVSSAGAVVLASGSNAAVDLSQVTFDTI